MADRESVRAELIENLVSGLNFSDDSVGVYATENLIEVFSGDHGLNGIEVIDLGRDTVVFSCEGFVYEIYWNSYHVDEYEMSGEWAIR